MDLLHFFARLAATYEHATPSIKTDVQQRMRPLLRRIKHHAEPAKRDPDTRMQLLDDIAEGHSMLDTLVGERQSFEVGSLGHQLRNVGMKL
jgi:hypothetical protein